MFYHPASNTYIREGVAFELPFEVAVDHPEVKATDPESGDVIQVTPAHTATEIQKTQFPANWLNAASPAEKAALGLQEVVTVGTRADDRYYWVSEQLVGAELRVTNTPKSLEMVGAQVWAQIKAAREAAEFGGFSWDGSVFDSDAMSQSRIQGAVLLASMAPAFSVDWTLADNTTRTLSAADLAQVGAALGQHVQACHSTARDLRQQVSLASTVEQLLALSWPVNQL